MGVPSEVFLAVSVFDIEPDNVIWDPPPIHFLVDIFHVLVCNVIPPTLVVSDCELLWKLGIPCQLAVLRNHFFRCRAEENENIQKATF